MRRVVLAVAIQVGAISIPYALPIDAIPQSVFTAVTVVCGGTIVWLFTPRVVRTWAFSRLRIKPSDLGWEHVSFALTVVVLILFIDRQGEAILSYWNIVSTWLTTSDWGQVFPSIAVGLLKVIGFVAAIASLFAIRLLYLTARFQHTGQTPADELLERRYGRRIMRFVQAEVAKDAAREREIESVEEKSDVPASPPNRFENAVSWLIRKMGSIGPPIYRDAVPLEVHVESGISTFRDVSWEIVEDLRGQGHSSERIQELLALIDFPKLLQDHIEFSLSPAVRTEDDDRALVCLTMRASDLRVAVAAATSDIDVLGLTPTLETPQES